MDLKEIVIVLSRPMDSRNIGASCRAMANSGIHTLRIVGDRGDYDDTEARRLSIHASYIWEGAEFFTSLKEATRDCAIVCATTRRRGRRRGRLYYPWEIADYMRGITGHKAMVFGNERTGLDDQEVLDCNIAATIPSCEDFPSLNLSHAVQVVGYELYKAALKDDGKVERIEAVGNERLVEGVTDMCDNLKAIGFFTKRDEGFMVEFWKKLLARGGITEGELKYAQSVFTKIRGLKIHHPTDNL